MKLDLILALGNKFGNLFVFAFILSRLNSVRNLLSKKPVKLWDKLKYNSYTVPSSCIQ